jgi:hypothetical protein
VDQHDLHDETHTSPPRSAFRGRVAVALCFFIMASIIGNWCSRVLDVRHAVGLGDTAWGLVTTATTVGQLLSLLLVTFLTGRVRGNRLTLTGAALLLVNGPPMARSITSVGSTAAVAAIRTGNSLAQGTASRFTPDSPPEGLLRCSRHCHRWVWSRQDR